MKKNNEESLEKESLKRMNYIKMLMTMLVILGPSTFFGYRQQNAEMGLSIVAGIAIVAFWNIKQLVRLKGAGIEVEFDRALQDARVTIQEMNELKIKIVNIFVKQLTYQEFLGGTPAIETVEMVKEVEEIAKNLNDDSINKCIFNMKYALCWSLFNKFICTYPLEKDDERGKLEKLRKGRMHLYNGIMDINDLITEAEIKQNISLETSTDEQRTACNTYLSQCYKAKKYADSHTV